MTIKDVGFGGTGTSAYATLSTLIREFAPERYLQAINLAAPLIGSGLLQKETGLEDEWTHTIFGGAYSSAAVVRDGARIPLGDGKIPHVLREQPANIISVLTMGRRAAKTKLKDNKLADLFDSSLELASEDAANLLAQQLHGTSVVPANTATWSGTAADSTVTIEFADLRMFKPGRAYDFIDTSASLAYVVRCTDISPSTIGSDSDAIAGTAAFINDVPNPATGSVVALGATAVAVDDVFKTRGETAGFGGSSATVDTALVNFGDIAGTASLHGKSSSDVAGWRGYTKALSADYSQEAVVRHMGLMHTVGGCLPNVAIMHPQMAAAHKAYTGEVGSAWGLATGISAARPMQVDSSADKYGNVYEDGGLRVGGAKICQDPCHPAKSITLFDNKKIKLGVWDEMGPEEEAGDATLLGRTFFDLGTQVSGGFNLLAYKRSAVGQITGITGL